MRREEVERGGRHEARQREATTTTTMMTASIVSFQLLLLLAHSTTLPLTSADAGAPAVVEGIVPRGLSGAANSRPSAASSSAASRLSLF